MKSSFFDVCAILGCVLLFAIASEAKKVSFLCPNKKVVWFVGNGINEMPVDFAGDSKKLRADDYTIILKKKAALFYHKNFDSTYSQMDLKAAIENTQESSRLNFDVGSDKAMSKLIDGNDYRLYLKPKSRSWLPSFTMARSDKFTILRLGAAPSVPSSEQFIEKILSPTYNQIVQVQDNSRLDLKTRLLSDIPVGKEFQIVVMEALANGREIVKINGKGKEKMVSGALIDFFIPLKMVKKGRYFIEFRTKLKWSSAVSAGLKYLFKQKVIYRSDPFYVEEKVDPYRRRTVRESIRRHTTDRFYYPRKHKMEFAPRNPNANDIATPVFDAAKQAYQQVSPVAQKFVQNVHGSVKGWTDRAATASS